MRRIWFSLAFLFCTNLAVGQESIEAVETYLKKEFPADQPGASVMVLKNGEPLLMRGYGLADVEKKKPITPESVFDLASVSKQFTSMAVMQLVERGRINYDDDIRKWIPELPEMESDKPIRVRDLLNQTSGLRDYLGLFKGSDEEFARLKNTDLPPFFVGKKLFFTPSTKFDYSNTNYAFLPIIVERASGKTFGAWMRDYVFRPLGMTSTCVMDDATMEIPNRTTGYSKALFSRKFELSRRDGPVCGDGNVFTTTIDLAKWDAGLRNNALVRAETLDLAYTPVPVPDHKTGKPGRYGFGWAVAEKDGKRIAVWHNGGWAGTSTSISRWLDDGLTIAVLCNCDSADADSHSVKIAKMLRKPK